MSSNQLAIRPADQDEILKATLSAVGFKALRSTYKGQMDKNFKGYVTIAGSTALSKTILNDFTVNLLKQQNSGELVKMAGSATDYALSDMVLRGVTGRTMPDPTKSIMDGIGVTLTFRGVQYVTNNYYN